MIELSISDINKKPAIIDRIDDIAQIINKKTNDVKGYFIPIAYKKYIEHAMQEIEYQKFLQRNRDLISSDMNEAGDTLLDGLDDRD